MSLFNTLLNFYILSDLQLRQIGKINTHWFRMILIFETRGKFLRCLLYNYLFKILLKMSLFTFSPVE